MPLAVATRQKITPFLWFDTRAEEAAEFYVSVFPNSGITAVSRYGEAGPGTPGGVFVVEFRLDGQAFTAINGGPQFTFDEAISFVIDCADQAEIDRFFDALTADGGEPGPCGWLKDKFGLSWQLVPSIVPRMLSGEDRAAADRVMQAVMGMGKIDIAVLERAYAG